MKSNHTHNKDHGNGPTADQEGKLSFQDIYGAILKQTEFTRGELSFLRRVIQRRLRDGTLYVDKEDLIFRPYRHLFYM